MPPEDMIEVLIYHERAIVLRALPPVVWSELAPWDRLTVDERADLLRALFALPEVQAPAA